ncbi:MAG: hypothetical protein ACRD9S_17675 [Pyrinomonadaceae bacterium]
MFRGFSIATTLILLVAATTVSSQAQSGRGRQLRLQGLLREEAAAPTPPNVQEDRRIDSGFSKPAALEIRRNGALIYNDAASNQKKDDGEYHMTKGDKRAGWILLGLLVLGGIGQIAQE